MILLGAGLSVAAGGEKRGEEIERAGGFSPGSMFDPLLVGSQRSRTIASGRAASGCRVVVG